MPGYLCDENGEPYNSATFDWQRYVAEKVPDPRLLETPEGRRLLTRLDPMLFGLIYCKDLIRNEEGEISFSDLHLELCRTARTWIRPPKWKENRHVYIAPRGGGKSTWGFKILILWVGAHRHVKFAAAFSNSSQQAFGHLAGLRQLMDGNEMLRNDYPDFCEPARRANGNTVSDSQEMSLRKNGFAFAARGIDTGVLGLVDADNERPDLILLDDIEPDETNYSIYQCQQRLLSVTDTILPMRNNARVLWIGTVTMPESLTHQLVKSILSPERPPEWISSEHFKVHYIPPIVTMPDGTERSFWEGKFPFDLGSPEKGGLRYERNSRAFKKNMENKPISLEGDYWSTSDFVYNDLDEPQKVLIQIDPAVTNNQGSDYTGVAVIAYQPGFRSRQGKNMDRIPKCAVWFCKAYKLPPNEMRKVVLKLIEKFPQVGGIRIEANQGGETWHSVYHNMPVQVSIHKEHVPKKVRASNLLNYYQRGQVLHREPFPALEEQMLAFPNVLNDDMVDAVGAGVHYFLAQPGKVRTRSIDYRKVGR